MALHREHVEKTQQEWLARVARERHNLSVSVEKTLSDTQRWDEEDEKGKNSGHTIYGKTLIPPRISLQSRVAPAIYRSNLGLEPEFVRTNVPVMTIGEDGELKAPSDSNMLSRFARCVTSSLAAIRLHKRPGARSEEELETPSTPLPALPRHKLPEMPTSKLEAVLSSITSTGKRKAVKDVAEHITLPPLTNMLDTPWQEVFKPLSSPMGRISSSMGSIAVSRPGETRHRLAGRATKIRLEAARPDGNSDAMPHVATPFSTGAKVPVAGTRRQREATGASTPMPAIGRREALNVATPGFLPDTPNMLYASAPLAAVKAKTGKQASVAGPKGGTGIFECTQRDATVMNANIGATSVVLVTLTSDPGPVVVHFVSIQPRVGFTVHLTAPTLKQTTFNYIIL